MLQWCLVKKMIGLVFEEVVFDAPVVLGQEDDARL